ncbi:hypothetical protein NEOLI_000193 [Neolecta irregularis DAH-3]|uniref:Uncharacterized protein n=1 Tax=Neolecta irregularis (strain DAH-3) TaxID=1198029 RepID=A0A1U7LTR3_NEOID|nr:hypothetical protein NEOLI_000193 [Neolecta irregularis DAH-3]|eukprot:OLL26019.1 hypothetical protein NEOLI_000193 [Neolecta irregularis DAH-3]
MQRYSRTIQAGTLLLQVRLLRPFRLLCPSILAGGMRGMAGVRTRLQACCTVAVVVGPAVVVGEQALLDLPDVGLHADAELEILLCDRVPELRVSRATRRGRHLVDHHDGEQVCDGDEEQAVEVVVCAGADGGRQRVQRDLAEREEEDAERDVEERPAVAQRCEHEVDLRRGVGGEDGGGRNVQHRKQRGGAADPAAERAQRDAAARQKHEQRRAAQQRQRQARAVLGQLEADGAVAQQAPARRGDQPALRGHRPRIHRRRRAHDARVQHQRHRRQQHVQVQERRHLAPPHRRVLGPDVGQHHAHHHQRRQLHHRRRPLEDQRVRKLDVARIARRPRAPRLPHQRAQRQRRRVADRRKRAECHGGRDAPPPVFMRRCHVPCRAAPSAVPPSAVPPSLVAPARILLSRPVHARAQILHSGLSSPIRPDIIDRNLYCLCRGVPQTLICLGLCLQVIT